MKLFKVTCRDMHNTHGVAYVVAVDAAKAYERLRADLDARNLGTPSGREMETVELLADASDYPECGRQLYRTL